MKWSEVTQSCGTPCNPWTVARQAPLSMEFSRQEYWYRLPFPSPEDLLNPGIEPTSPGRQIIYWKMLSNTVLEKPLESPLDCKEIKPVHPKGGQRWIFTGRIEAEAPVYWPRDVKSRLIGKDPDVGKDWGQMKKRAAEDEIVGWHQLPTQCTWVWANSGR